MFKPTDSILTQLPDLNKKSCLEAALFYASLGLPVLPIAGVSKTLGYCHCPRGYNCDSPGKHPLTEHGVKDVTTDPEIIKAWFRRWPTANVGIATGSVSGIIVIDKDDPNSNLHFDTLTVETSGGKSHFYLALNGQEVRSSVGKIAPQIDVRGEGGYVVAPPSNHRSGSQYKWRNSVTTIAPFPTELLMGEKSAAPSINLIGGFSAPIEPTTKISAVAEPKPRLQAAIAEGQRNSELFRIGSAMRGRGQNEDEILAELLRVNEERCQPPLGEDEVKRIAASAATQVAVQTDEQVIRNLVKMSPVEYDKNREAAAEQLGIRVTTLDDEVKKQRGLVAARIQEQRDQAEWERLKAGPLEDGAQLFADIVAFLKRFLYLSAEQYIILAVWVLHTHVLDAFEHTPYLDVKSATKRCGKSRVFEILEHLVARAWYTMRTSAAALVRKVATGVTLLLDESDTAFREDGDYSEKLRGIFNAGFKRTGTYSLCEKTAEGKWEVTDLPVWGAKAIAGIGRLPDTIADRALPVLMQRKPPHVKVEKFRVREVRSELAALKKRCEKWAAQNLEVLRTAKPAIPEQLDDRGADIAEPLFAVADAAGGEWAAKIRAAVLELRGAQLADDRSAIGELLGDIRGAFQKHGKDKISTYVLLNVHLTVPGKRWATCDHGRPLNERGLAAMLRPLNIQPCNIRLDTAVLKGYHEKDFKDAFAAYLSEPSAVDKKEQEPQSESVDLSDFFEEPSNIDVESSD